jgi:hypothetical protein
MVNIMLFDKEKDIDDSYQKSLVDDAIKNISKFGDFEWFISNEPVQEVKPECPWTIETGCPKDCSYRDMDGICIPF